MENAPKAQNSMVKRILIVILALLLGIGGFFGYKSLNKPTKTSFNTSSNANTRTTGVLVQEGLTTNHGGGYSLGRPSYLNDINSDTVAVQAPTPAPAPIPTPAPVPVVPTPAPTPAQVAPTPVAPVVQPQTPYTAPIAQAPTVQRAPTPTTQTTSPAPVVQAPIAPIPVAKAPIVTEPSAQDLAKQQAEEKAKAQQEMEAQIARQKAAESAKQATPAPKTASPDSIIGAHFIEDIARYFVQNYTPSTKKNASGTVHVKVSNINAYYGTELRALPKSGDKAYTRKYILDTIFVPNRFTNLYNLYGDLFIEQLVTVSVDQYGNRKAFKEAEQKQMLVDYANVLRRAGQSLQSIGTLPDYKSLLARKNAAAKSLFDERRMFMEIQARYEEARLRNNETVKETLREDLFKCAKRIEDAQLNARLIDADIVSQIKKKNVAVLDDNSLLFLFDFVGRRHQAHAQIVANELGLNCVKLASDMQNKAKMIGI